VSFILIIVIFRAGVAHEIPISVVDHDNSKLSRLLITAIESSPTMKIRSMPTSTSQAIKSIQRGETYGVVIIPPNFSRDTLLQTQPKVTAMLNTQYILIGKILTSALSSTVMQSSGQVEYIKNLVDTQNPSATINSISPIGIQTTSYFNMYKNYFYFLVSALIPSLWQIFIVIATLVAVGSIFKAKQEIEILGGSRYIGAKLIGLMLPYTIAFTLMGILYLLYMYSMWEFQGSYAILILGQLLTVIAYQNIALLLFTLGFDYTRSLSLGAVYTAPAFAFLGVTFPIYSMNSFALFWRDILPISHYMQLQISQANYGANIYMEIDKLVVLLLFGLLSVPVILMFGRRLQRSID